MINGLDETVLGKTPKISPEQFPPFEFSFYAAPCRPRRKTGRFIV